MRRYWLGLLLGLAPTGIAQASEIDGVDSRAIDISVSYGAADPASPAHYGAAFTSYGDGGRANGITVQSRRTEGLLGVVECAQTVPLPAGARRVTHPALSKSGWLFVSAQTERGWRLFATRRSPSLREVALGHCGGWANGWDDLGSPGGTTLSAPDAVVAYGEYTLVFVTDGNGRIHHRMFDSDARAERNPRRLWREWQALQVPEPSRENRPYYAASKPAVAIYDAIPRANAGINYLHVFWLDRTFQSVQHVRAEILWNGRLGTTTADARALGRAANTACSAGPEIEAPAQLFVVCGAESGAGTSGYAIARYRNPHLGWSAEGAVEPVEGRPWIMRTAYGGTSAPSLGSTGGLGGIPIMFMTVGDIFCPPSGRLLPTCAAGRLLAIQNRWVRPRDGEAGLADWRDARPAAPLD
jgi:hypothetical protein